MLGVLGCLAALLPGRLGAWVPGRLGAWLPGRLGARRAWVLGCLGACDLPGFLGTGRLGACVLG